MTRTETAASSSAEEVKVFADKLRVYAISDQVGHADPLSGRDVLSVSISPGRCWPLDPAQFSDHPICRFCAGPQRVHACDVSIRSDTGTALLTPRCSWIGFSATGVPGQDFPHKEMVLNEWLGKHIQYGPLGEQYPDVRFGMEGDTPSFIGCVQVT